MNREEAINKLKELSDDGEYTLYYYTNKLIDKIYDDFESRNCENCNNRIKTEQYNFKCLHDIDMTFLDRGCECYVKNQLY